MLAEAERRAFADDDAAVGKVRAEKVLHHGKGFCGGDDRRLGIDLHKLCDVGGVVRLHVLHDQIVGLAAAEGVLNVVKPFMCKTGVNCIHDSDLFVYDGIGVIRHAVGDNILPLEQIDLVVVDAEIKDGICNLFIHSKAPLLKIHRCAARKKSDAQPRMPRCVRTVSAPPMTRK